MDKLTNKMDDLETFVFPNVIKSVVKITPDNKFYKCPMCYLGLKPNKYIHIPVKDKYGIPKWKYMEILVGGDLHKKLLSYESDLSKCYIVE